MIYCHCKRCGYRFYNWTSLDNSFYVIESLWWYEHIKYTCEVSVWSQLNLITIYIYIRLCNKLLVLFSIVYFSIKKHGVNQYVNKWKFPYFVCIFLHVSYLTKTANWMNETHIYKVTERFHSGVHTIKCSAFARTCIAHLFFVVVFLFVCVRSVSSVPNVAWVSGLSIIDCDFDFL